MHFPPGLISFQLHEFVDMECLVDSSFINQLKKKEISPGLMHNSICAAFVWTKVTLLRKRCCNLDISLSG